MKKRFSLFAALLLFLLTVGEAEAAREGARWGLELCLQLLIPSATGKAVVIMPILAPLAELTGFTRQTAVLAYQFGTGLTMHFWPTGGIMHGCCATAGVTYSKWVRFFAPLLAILFVLASAALLIAQAVGYGPF